MLLENHELRATNEQLREQLRKLADRHSELAREHAALKDSFGRLVGKDLDKHGKQRS